jgi:Tol biopolymer transport system component
VARRDKNFDLFRLPVEGGEQQRLTANPGYDDGPDYSPDGRWIYFNSDRSGKWGIWRMPADGAGADDNKAQQGDLLSVSYQSRVLVGVATLPAAPDCRCAFSENPGHLTARS